MKYSQFFALKFPDCFEIKIAETPLELEEAYRLLYKVYLEAGYTKPNLLGLRVFEYNYLQTTKTFIAKTKGQKRELVGTITIIDGIHTKLPIEKIYEKEILPLRQRNIPLAEISGLAIHRKYRFKNVCQYLSQYVAAYALLKDMENLLIAVHPKHKDFYQKCLGFQQIGEEKPYPTAQGNPSVALYLNLKERLKNTNCSYISKNIPQASSQVAIEIANL